MHTIVVMGVSGTGKTTVGRLLADRLGVPYAEADDFHPPANIAKMAAGMPLDDADREPWLRAIGEWAAGHRDRGGVVSCSALKRRYRDRLRADDPDLFFLHLSGEPALVARRLDERKGHFMPKAMLDSQLAALEPLGEDEAGMATDVTASPQDITERAVAALRRRTGPGQ
ncbi:gluconokinase [Wenjunlia tyrosinilytica]|uniref:Gluconokinase n=2 Tax=Wenjunlia tyrosinilytica TaxID=1544741 RepID=A0A917ZJI5_9ACTN|nr:gluconokinase [Wenjunlia tyrosinilytica]